MPMNLEDSNRLNNDHERLCAQLPPILDAAERERNSFKAGKNSDVDLQRWANAFTPAHQIISLQDELWNEHHSRVHALEVYVITKAMTKVVGENETTSDRVSPWLEAIHKNEDEIRVRKDKQLNRFWEEGKLLQMEMDKRVRERERAKHEKEVVLPLAVGGVVLVVLFAWGVWRAVRGPAPPLPLASSDVAPAAAPSARQVPILIGGNIDVVRPIGRGGMGEVYEGLDRTLQRKVALKRLRPELTGSASDLSRLLNEARLVAALKHPNIVAIHSVEKEASQVFLVFEYVDGPTLATYISQRKQVGWPEALRIFQGAASALHAAHGSNIIHRDLKPGNIMLDSKGVVKVMDFGIAHEAALVVSRLTSSGAWGTPPYMSPEQELGEVNTGVDLFALNVCLYEMLTGEIPFTGPNFLAQKREKFYTPVTKAVPVLPKALDSFFATAFDPDPLRRFQDAAALSAAAGSLA